MSISSTGLSDWEFGRLLVKPKEACRLLACGNTRLYELISANELETFLDGRSRKITVASINQYIQRRVAPTAPTKATETRRRGKSPNLSTSARGRAA
jgi:excisionase family DNA binding protein